MPGTGSDGTNIATEGAPSSASMAGMKLHADYMQPFHAVPELLVSYTLRVICLSVDEHHAVTQWLESHKLQFHTFSIARTPSLLLVLHRLDTDSDPQAVLGDLQELGFPRMLSISCIP